MNEKQGAVLREPAVAPRSPRPRGGGGEGAISSVAEAPTEYVDRLDRFIEAGDKYPKGS